MAPEPVILHPDDALFGPAVLAVLETQAVLGLLIHPDTFHARRHSGLAGFIPHKSYYPVSVGLIGRFHGRPVQLAKGVLPDCIHFLA